MITKIISGGQTGADQAALRAARRFGIETGGWAPKGWATEAGQAAWLADYGLVECRLQGYPPRTAQNVADSDLTVFFGDKKSSGYGATYWATVEHKRPFFHIPASPSSQPRLLAGTFLLSPDKVVNIAGNRESRAPGIGKRVEEYLAEVFRIMGLKEVEA